VLCSSVDWQQVSTPSVRRMVLIIIQTIEYAFRPLYAYPKHRTLSAMPSKTMYTSIDRANAIAPKLLHRTGQVMGTSGVPNSHSATMYATIRGATAVAMWHRHRTSDEAWLEDRLRRTSVRALWKKSRPYIRRHPRALLHSIYPKWCPISNLSRYW